MILRPSVRTSRKPPRPYQRNPIHEVMSLNTMICPQLIDKTENPVVPIG